MKKLILLICVFFLSCTLLAQNYRNTGSRNRMTTILRNYANQQRSSQTRSSQKQEGLRSSTKTNKLESDEIALVVNGEGQTKDEATASALRRAIEQAFGTFVSANTTLLNDDIVRDEIATVTSGNIKSYKELSSIQNADGIYNVSVSAVVSIGKLISYAQSHGSSAEFAGQTFMMNMKMRELNKRNEYEALQNLVVQLKSLQNDIFDYEIQVNDPKQKQRKQISEEERFLSGYEIPENDPNESWEIPVKLVIKTNQNYLAFITLIDNTVSSLSLSKEEREEYQKNNMEFVAFNPFGWRGMTREELSEAQARYYGIAEIDELRKKGYSFLRNPSTTIKDIAYEIVNILNDAQRSCLIKAVADKEKRRFLKKIDCDTLLVSRSGTSNGPSLKICPSEKMKHVFLPRKANIIFSEYIITFNFSPNELYSIRGFEVIKVPIPESNIQRFMAVADYVGFPYSMDGNVMIIRTTYRTYYLDIENESIKTYDRQGKLIDRYTGRMGTFFIYNYDGGDEFRINAYQDHLGHGLIFKQNEVDKYEKYIYE